MGKIKKYNNLFKYSVLNTGLVGLNYSYIVFEENYENTWNISDTDTGISTISPKVYQVEISEDDVKIVNFSTIDKLEKDVIDTYMKYSYYDEKFDLDTDLSFNEIINKIQLFRNILASKNRIGLPNIIHIPKFLYKKYYFLFSQIDGVVESEFIGHDDKIFCLYLKENNYENTITVYTNTELLESRYLKLKRIIKKVSNKDLDRDINYHIIKNFENLKYNLGYIKLK